MQNQKIIQIVAVRHGNTDATSPLLSKGNAWLSKESTDRQQISETEDKFIGMEFDLVSHGATFRMMHTAAAIQSSLKSFGHEECDTRLDSRTNSHNGELYPVNQDDTFIHEYHETAQKILRTLSLKLPDGGKALLVTTGAIIVPFEVLANGRIPISEAHYQGAIYKEFAPKPAEVRCFTLNLENGEFRSTTLDAIKES